MNREFICNVITSFIYLLLILGIQAGLYAIGNTQVVWFWDLLFERFK